MAEIENVRIVPFEPRYAKDFAELNYEWIEKYFAIEPYDREMLDDPGGRIIEKGGAIFFAVTRGKAVGTVALINASERTFELAKMAVAPEHRGHGIGDLLMSACIEYGCERGKSIIYLLSNTKLDPAIALYRKHGFVETPRDEQSPYERVNIRMELALNKSKL